LDRASARRLGPVQEPVGLGGVAVEIVFAVEHPQGDERVEEVARAAPVQSEPPAQRPRVRRPLRQLGEHADLDRARQGLGASATEAELQDTLRADARVRLRAAADVDRHGSLPGRIPAGTRLPAPGAAAFRVGT